MDILLASPILGPILIFLLRISDVSLGTLRMILVLRGARTWVPVLAALESLIWVLAVGSAIRNLTSPLHLAGYAGGYATGNLVGMWLEGKLALGLATLRVISKGSGVEVAEALRENGVGATEFVGQGREGRVEMIYSVVKRRQVVNAIRVVEAWDPDAFIAVDEPRVVRRGQFLMKRR